MARILNFHFNYTCPAIDKNIETIKEYIRQEVQSLVEDISPRIPENIAFDISQEYTLRIYESIEYAIEEIRSTNESMRTEAESQISDLIQEVDQIKDEKNELENQIESYLDAIRNLESELEEMKSKLQQQ